MTSLQKLTLMGLAAALALTSCLKSDPLPLRVVALGVTQCSPDNPSEWWFMGDDSTTYVSSERRTNPVGCSQRSIAAMELTTMERRGYHYVVSFVEHLGLYTFPVTSTGEAAIDTFPNDPLELTWASVSLQYLNVSFSVWGSNASQHRFALLRDSLWLNEPIPLTLRFDARSDRRQELLSGIISFDLETLAERAVKDSVRLTLITPSGDSREFTYRFHK